MVLGGFSVFFRRVLESGYDIGSKVADANEKRQEAVQAGTRGTRDVRIFGVADELYRDFQDPIEQYTTTRIILRRNETAIQKFYNLVVAISVFALIYLALTFANLSLGSLGVFLFAMFRLGPKASAVNSKLHQIENDMPHLVRTLSFIEELESHKESKDGTVEIPEKIEKVEFNDVWFSYNMEEQILQGIDFEFKKREFVGFVGQSGPANRQSYDCSRGCTRPIRERYAPTKFLLVK